MDVLNKHGFVSDGDSLHVSSYSNGKYNVLTGIETDWWIVERANDPAHEPLAEGTGLESLNEFLESFD